MAAVEKATTSAVLKSKLASAIASVDTQTVIKLSSRIAAAQAAQPGTDQQALPYAQAVAERQ